MEFWNRTGWRIAWYFCTFGLPMIIVGAVISQL